MHNLNLFLRSSILIVALSFVGCQQAQDSADYAADAVEDAVTSNDRTTALATDFPRHAAALRDYAMAMPADKYGFKPVPEVNSFGQSLTHATGATVGIISAVSDLAPPEINMEATDKDEIIANIEAVYAWAGEAVAAINDADLENEVSLFGGSLNTTVAGAIDLASNHSTHHKGGLVVYLRLNGVTPPAFAGI